MFDIKKRAFCENVGELRTLLADYPDNTPLVICGIKGFWIHFNDDAADNTFICLDDESLDDYYGG